MNTVVIVGQTLQASHALFFHLPQNNETTAQPVKAWSIGKAFDFGVPSCLAISCAAIYLKYLPTPNASHTSVAGILCI